MLASFAKVARAAKVAGGAKVAEGAKVAKVAKVARFPETMDRDMQVGDSFDGEQHGDGLKEAMRGRL